MGRTFPHKLTDKSGKPGPDFYGAFTATPMANDLEVELAKAAVAAAENLGQRDVTDLLALSFTANDVIGHAFGPESHEVQDAAVRVDRSIADLLAFLEKQVGGKHNLVVVFTTDHGATPTPEYMASLGPAGRIKKAAIEKAVNKALGERFGAGEWVLAIEDPSVFLNQKLVIERKLDFATVQEVAGAAAMGIPGFAGYFTRTQLLGGTLPSTPVAHSYQLSFYAPRSGDVLLLTQPFYFWGKYGEKNEGSTQEGSTMNTPNTKPLTLPGQPPIRTIVPERVLDTAVLRRDPHGRVVEVRSTIIAGFLRGDRFYIPKKAVRALASRKGLHRYLSGRCAAIPVPTGG